MEIFRTAWGKLKKIMKKKEEEEEEDEAPQQSSPAEKQYIETEPEFVLSEAQKLLIKSRLERNRCINHYPIQWDEYHDHLDVVWEECVYAN